ncbi:MAG: serine hydroxymethyltransferase [Desulfobacterales bacterium]|nr:serine hydroxymethyltransferase [Desulfobacterales bacterium]
MINNLNSVKEYDLELWNSIDKEFYRQETHAELIASENYPSIRVLEVQGSVLNNKYAEGYPGKRYYEGCQYVDIAETLAIERAKKIFNADYANAQPHSGSQANAAVCFALLNPGDTILGMGLSDGGHLTHGSKVSFSGSVYNSISYGLDPLTGEINYKEMESKAKEYKPKLIIGGFSSYSRTVDWEKMRAIADEVGAFFMADIAHVAGLVVADLYPSPVQLADVTTTTTHKTLRGPRGGLILAKANPKIEKKLNSSVFPYSQGGPLMHVIAAKALAFKEAMEPEFRVYQQNVINNARAMVKASLNRGYDVVSGGTDNHLFLIDFTKKNLTGKQAVTLLNQTNITVNKNNVPNDPHPPTVTSGIRVGTPAVTTRGFTEDHCIMLMNWMCDVLDDPENKELALNIKKQVTSLCMEYPVYDANISCSPDRS